MSKWPWTRNILNGFHAYRWFIKGTVGDSRSGHSAMRGMNGTLILHRSEDHCKQVVDSVAIQCIDYVKDHDL
jgi:hypothetical protein